MVRAAEAFPPSSLVFADDEGGLAVGHVPNRPTCRGDRPGRGVAAQSVDLLNNVRLEDLLGEGRIYGGGLHKLEPKELANVPAAAVVELLPRQEKADQQPELLGV